MTIAIKAIYGLKLIKTKLIAVTKQLDTYLKPDQLKRLYKRHFQGALVRSGASLFMWLFALVSFLVDSIQAEHLIGISLCVAFLIGMNPPTLWFLKHTIRRRRYETISIVINFLEIIGYTAIIYALGGINSLFLSPIYAALIVYVGVVGPSSLPFRIASLCAMALGLMVALEYFGIIPHLDPFLRKQLPGSNQIIQLLATVCLLYVVAFISSYTGTLLKRNKKKLREQNTELERSRLRLTEATVRLEKKNVELQIAVNRAQESDRMKSEFLANMSHELRTPLNHIIGFTELIVDKKFGDLNEVQQEYLNDVLQSSDYLLSLINDILDLSVVEAGKLMLQYADVDIRNLLANSLNMVKEKAHKHGITLSLNMDDVLDTFTADERKLKQVMYNLLSNAVKFTPDGGTVSASAKIVDRIVRPGRRDGDPENFRVIQKSKSNDSPGDSKLTKCVEFAVSDNGIGISPEYQKRIFDRFEQADGSLRKKYQGAGLGLSLSKNIVELHGGQIWIESEGSGKGCTFRFAIPA